MGHVNLVIRVGWYVACGIERTETYRVGILRTAILVIATTSAFFFGYSIMM